MPWAVLSYEMSRAMKDRKTAYRGDMYDAIRAVELKQPVRRHSAKKQKGPGKSPGLSGVSRDCS